MTLEQLTKKTVPFVVGDVIQHFMDTYGHKAEVVAITEDGKLTLKFLTMNQPAMYYCFSDQYKKVNNK